MYLELNMQRNYTDKYYAVTNADILVQVLHSA
jgi:hypothetical protein